jgi:hypothetical protein
MEFSARPRADSTDAAVVISTMTMITVNDAGVLTSTAVTGGLPEMTTPTPKRNAIPR